MKCPRCQHENRPAAKFCEECAAPLARACTNCGAQLSATAKFSSECAHPAGSAAPTTPQRFGAPEAYTPKHLAEKILTSRAALEGERKQVTVLFVDVSGFTSMSERLDPEDVHRLMTRVFELMLDEVHRYEGNVNQFLGDGIMALFGAPIAHEDHARRALHAALGIRTKLDSYQADQCLELAERTGARKNLVKGWCLIGEIATARRQWDTAEMALRRALEIAQAVDNPTQLWKTQVTWGRLLAETGRRMEAHAAYADAAAVIEDIRRGLRTPALREGFARASFVHTIEKLAAGSNH
jgi:class 3 adenylate cyclase